jgi:hypothetical protein
VQQAGPGEVAIIAAGGAAPAVAAALKGTGIRAPESAESIVLLNTGTPRGSAILACGYDSRGFVYALLELADRVRLITPAALKIDRPVIGRPANPVRSVMRQFTSEPSTSLGSTIARCGRTTSRCWPQSASTVFTWRSAWVMTI